MKPWLRLLPLLMSFAVLLEPTASSAQSVSIDDQGFRIRRRDDRRTDQEPDAVNRKDCLDDDPSEPLYDPEDDTGSRTYLEFAIEIRGFQPRDTLQIWASRNSDCTDRDERQLGGNCRLVYTSSQLAGFIHEAIVFPRVVIARRSVLDFESDDTLVAGGGDAEYPSTEVCNERIDNPFAFYIMLMDADQIRTSTVWDGTRIDTSAPAAPTSLSANPGESNIFLEWKVPAENEEPDADGFAFYCVPAGTMGSQDAGQGGAGGAGPINPDCDQGVLTQGQLPSDEAESEFRCGSVRGLGTREGQASGLENGTTYAVAVASRDTLDNRGELSVIACSTPAEVTTFFERYKGSGGKGGGGFCSFSPLPQAHLLFASAFFVGVLVVRRRRRRLR